MEMQNQNALVVKKSNDFILSKYKLSSSLEGKLIAFSLTRLQLVDGTPEATFHVGELKKLLYSKNKEAAVSDKNIYTKLKKISTTMTSHSILMEDEKKKKFVSFSLITKASYDDGEFKMTYNRELTPFVYNLKQNFTTYGIENIIEFESVYSLKIYEILRKEAYRLSNIPMIEVEYSLSELRALLGLIDMPEPEMERLLSKGLSWEEIEKTAKSTQIPAYGNFKRRVLNKAKEEINKYSDIFIDFSEVFAGKGGKTKAIIFSIRKNDGREELPLELLVFEGHNGLTKKDLENLYKDANKDVSAIKDAVELAKDTPHIENYVGWLRSCVKGGWTGEKIETLHGSKEKADQINTIKEKLEEAKKDPNGEFFVNMFANISKKPEFETFINSLSEREREYYEFCDYQTKVESFFDYRKSSK